MQSPNWMHCQFLLHHPLHSSYALLLSNTSDVLKRNILIFLKFLMCGRDSNDVYDFDTGVDKNKKESVVNLVGRWVFLRLVFGVFLFSFAFSIWYKEITLLVYSLSWIYTAAQEPSSLPTCALLLASLGWLGQRLLKETCVQYCFLLVQLFVAIYIR